MKKIVEGIHRKNKENNRKAASLAIILWIIFGAFITMQGTVVAPKDFPHNIWGTAIEGVTPPGLGVDNGREISGWIDGVCYGTTTTVNSMFDLYVESDGYLSPTFDGVKDGGYNGDTILLFLDYDPMDYYLNASHTTLSHQGGSIDYVDPIFFNRTDLAPGLTTLRLLKINEIVLDPGDDLPQYVIIYDPVQHLGMNNITDYYLQKDNNFTHTPDGDTFDFLTHVSDITDMSNGYYYINLTCDLELNDSDELKLVWKSPYAPNNDPALTGPGNGTDIVVDRVEWGNYSNYIDPITPWENRDYDNTTMLDFLDVSNLYGTGASMIRTDDKFSSGYSGNGTDTDNCSADFKVLNTATPRPQMLGGPVHNIDTDEYFDIIQAAIDDPDTQDGHTITVPAGTYTEDVNINKSISLIGKNCATTTIQGMVTLNMSSVNIRNFKIENPGATSLLLLEVFFTNLEKLWLEDNDLAIRCIDSNNVTIQECLIRNNTGKGMEICMGASSFTPDNITVKNNTIINNTYGIDLNQGINCAITNNTFSQNRNYGIYVSSSTNTRVFHNNIIGNKEQAYDDGNNQWDNGYPSGGNFWSDYTGLDEFSDPDQDVPGNDGVGETNCTIDDDSVDRFPLMFPIGDYIFLYQGWNLVSIPLIQSETNLNSIFKIIEGTWDTIWWYNSSDSQDQWKLNNTSKPTHMNDLEDMNHTVGIWIHITDSSGVLFQYPGMEPIENQKISLYPGWNLVGFPSFNRKDRTSALNTITFGTEVDAVWTYNAAGQRWDEIAAYDYFEIGRGYWIHSKVEKVWDVPL